MALLDDFNQWKGQKPNKKQAKNSAFDIIDQSIEKLKKQQEQEGRKAAPVSVSTPDFNSLEAQSMQGVKLDPVKAAAQKTRNEAARKNISVPSVEDDFSIMDDILKPLEQGVLRFSNSVNQGLFGINPLRDQAEWTKQGRLDTPDKFLQAATPADTLPEKIIEGAGFMTGAALPVAKGYQVTKPLFNLATKSVTNPFAREAIRGGLAGAAYGIGTEGRDELANLDTQSIQGRLGDIALETAFGAVADPAAMFVGRNVVNPLLRNYQLSRTINDYITNESNKFDLAAEALQNAKQAETTNTPRTTPSYTDPLIRENISFTKPQATARNNVEAKPNQPIDIEALNSTLRAAKAKESFSFGQPSPIQARTGLNIQEPIDIPLNPKQRDIRQQIKFGSTEDSLQRRSTNQEMQQAVREEFEQLKRIRNTQHQPLDNGALLRDEDGYVTDRTKTISSKPEWLLNFERKNGRKPNDAELREIASRNVRETFQPGQKVKQIEEEINWIVNEQVPMVQHDPIALESVMKNLDRLEGEYKRLVPEEVDTQTMQSLKDTLNKQEVKWNELNDIEIAREANKKEWYHGTGTADLTPEKIDPFLTNHEGLFGQGLYLTDEPNIAKGYARSRGKRNTPTIYKAKVNIDRVLDLEKPLTEEVKNILNHTFRGLNDEYGDYDFEGLIENNFKNGKTFEKTFSDIKELIGEHSRDNGWSTSEYVELFSDFLINMKKAGYDGVTHTGGLRTGNEKHRVLILLDPNDTSMSGRSNQVLSFDKFLEGAEATNKVPASRKRNETFANKVSFGTDFKPQVRTGIQVNGPINAPLNPQQRDIIRGLNFSKPSTSARGLQTNEKVDPIALRGLLEGKKEVAVTAPKPIENVKKELTELKGTQGFFGQSVLGSKQTTTKTITRQEVVDNIRKYLPDVPIRTGRLTGPVSKARGIFKVGPEVIRTKKDKDLVAITHEIGHYLDKKHNLGLNPTLHNELRRIAQSLVQGNPNYTAAQHVEEGIAEFTRRYLTEDHAQLKQDAPQFFKFFETVMPQKVFKGLQQTRSDIDVWVSQGAANQLRGKINRTGKSAEDTLSQKIHKVYTALVDQFHPLSIVEKDLSGGKLRDATQSLYKKARLSIGATKEATLYTQELRQIAKDLDKIGHGIENLGDYATAIHARELNGLGIESGFTDAEILDTIQKFKSPEMDALQKRLVQYSDRLLDILVDSGRLSQDSVNAMRAKYKDYVPFYRHFEEDMTDGLTGNRGFANLTNPVKRLKGSSRDVIDPIESIIRNTFAVMNVAKKNEVGRELLRLSQVDGAGKYIERLQINPFEAGGVGRKEGIVTVYENGKAIYLQLDKELYHSIQKLDDESSNMLVKILAAPANILRAGATLTPEFMLRNPIRDQLQAYVVSDNGYKPFYDLARGMFHIAKKNTGVYERWLKSGGAHGQYVSQDRNHLREEVARIMRGVLKHNLVHPKRWINFLQAISELSEEATKVGEFNRGIKKGLSDHEAAFRSRDLMDFGRVGTDMKQMNRVIAFLNANLQGKDRIARAFLKHPVRSTVRSLTALTMPTIGLYMWATGQIPGLERTQKQKEDYENIPQWQKDTFFIVPIPGTDEYARIPKPFDLSVGFSNIPEQIMRYMQQQEPQAWTEFVKESGVQLVNLPYMLTGLTPIIENLANHSFFSGTPIVPLRDQDLLPEDQYGANTSLTAQAIGKVTKSSPYKVDNLIRGYGAGLGKYTTDLITDPLLEKAGVGKLPPKPKQEWYEWVPGVKGFAVSQNGGGKEMDKFYKTLDLLTKQKNSATKNEERFLDTNSLKTFRKIDIQIKDVRKQYREVQESHTITPEQKRKQMDQFNDLMIQLAKRANSTYNGK